MKKGDKIIWDSNWGYELAYFIEDSDSNMYNTYKINLVTGCTIGPSMRSKDKIIPYNESTILLMETKYGYKKTY